MIDTFVQTYLYLTKLDTIAVMITWIVFTLMSDLCKCRYAYKLNTKLDNTGALVYQNRTELYLAITQAITRIHTFSFWFSSFLLLSFLGVGLLSAAAFSQLHMRG